MQGVLPFEFPRIPADLAAAPPSGTAVETTSEVSPSWPAAAPASGGPSLPAESRNLMPSSAGSDQDAATRETVDLKTWRRLLVLLRGMREAAAADPPHDIRGRL